MSLLPLSLEPGCLYYKPDFVTREEEANLLGKVYSAPKSKWTTLLNRRLQNWGGTPSSKGMITESLPTWLSSCIEKIVDTGVFSSNGTTMKPNHILVNEYLPGQGIMPHTDGPIYHPVVTTISLGSHTVIKFYRPVSGSHQTDVNYAQGNENSDADTSFSSRHVASVLLEPRSLFVVTGEMYSNMLHGIEEVKEDVISCGTFNADANQIGDTLSRTTRVSLTIRHVLKTVQAKRLFPNLKL